MPNETNAIKKPAATFATILANYPLPYEHRPDRTPANNDVPVTDDNPSSFLYYNQCAIRMSMCLEGSGISLAGATNITNPGGDVYTDSGCIAGAFNLANYLKREVFGQPVVYDGTKDDCETLLNGKTGIIFFQYYNENYGDDTTAPSRSANNVHVDLWNENIIMAPYYDQMMDSTTIWFWEIN